MEGPLLRDRAWLLSALCTELGPLQRCRSPSWERLPRSVARGFCSYFPWLFWEGDFSLATAQGVDVVAAAVQLPRSPAPPHGPRAGSQLPKGVGGGKRGGRAWRGEHSNGSVGNKERVQTLVWSTWGHWGGGVGGGVLLLLGGWVVVNWVVPCGERAGSGALVVQSGMPHLCRSRQLLTSTRGTRLCPHSLH